MSTTIDTERPSGRHPVNVGHLVMGVAFLALVGVWALVQADVVGDSDVRWLLPVPWVLGGLAGLLAVGMSSGKRWSTRQVGWVEPAYQPFDGPDVPEAPVESHAPAESEAPAEPEAPGDPQVTDPSEEDR
jgi:hypothetical protein